MDSCQSVIWNGFGTKSAVDILRMLKQAMKQINCIGVLTSGGDAPGMNTSPRAVTRAAIPEEKTDVDQLATFIGRGIRKSKNSSTVIVSESSKNGKGAEYYANRI